MNPIELIHSVETRAPKKRGTPPDEYSGCKISRLGPRPNPILTGFVDLGVEQAGRWYAGWRMFFIVCSETFAFNNGNEWFVSHYLFAKK